MQLCLDMILLMPKFSVFVSIAHTQVLAHMICIHLDPQITYSHVIHSYQEFFFSVFVMQVTQGEVAPNCSCSETTSSKMSFPKCF